jgi:hypothetical protein
MINEQDKKRAERICIHEAGHLITSKINGFKTNGITIIITQSIGHSGDATICLPKENITDMEKLIDYLEKRIQILYAGVIAEFTDLWGNFDDIKAISEWTVGGGIIDYAKVRELINLLRDIKYTATLEKEIQQRELDTIDNELFNSTVELIRGNIDIIHRIGIQLKDKITNYDVKYCLTELEINTLLNS